jgi:hypothetical protein
MMRHANDGRNLAWLAWVLVPAILLLVMGANAHLVYVAVQSQPDCVEHSQAAGEGNSYRAAKPVC